MSIDFKYFPDVFAEIVASARARYDLDNVLPYFEYGTYFELLEACQLKDNNQLAKYPLVWLVWDASENKETWTEEYIYTISPRVFIATLTSLDQTTADRYTNTMKAVLYPIFALLTYEIDYHENIGSKDYKTSVNDHPFWLNNDDGSFDVLSAIELKFENLLLIKTI